MVDNSSHASDSGAGTCDLEKDILYKKQCKKATLVVIAAIMVGLSLVLGTSWKFRGLFYSSEVATTLTYRGQAPDASIEANKVSPESSISLVCHFTIRSSSEDACPDGVRWKFNGSQLPEDIPHYATIDREKKSVNISKVRTDLVLGPFMKTEDTGKYTCECVNGTKVENTHFFVIVKDSEVGNGTSLLPHLEKRSYECIFSLRSQPTLLWQFRRPWDSESEEKFSQATGVEVLDDLEPRPGRDVTLTSYSYEGKDIEWMRGDKNLFTCRVKETEMKITMEMVTIDQDAFFLCSFTEVPVTTFVTWKRSMAPINKSRNSKYRILGSRLVGSNASSSHQYDALFHLVNPTQEDSGNYSCTIQTLANETISGKFFLNLTEQQIDVVGVYEKNATVLECKSVRTYSKSYFKWYKEGNPVTNDPRFEVYEGRRNDDYEDGSHRLFSARLKRMIEKLEGRKTLLVSFLLIKGAQTSDSGNYSCEVSTEDGESFSRKYKLKVLPHELI